MKRLVAGVAAISLLCVLTACAPATKLRALPPGVQPGGRLTVGILAPRSIAPWLTSTLDPYGTLVVETMCDQVVALDPVTAGMVPSIAGAWRLQSAKLMHLQLRKGVRFPDGTEMSTGDVIESISRAARADVASPAADVLKIVNGYDILSGLQSAEESDPKVRERLFGVFSPDPGAVEISLTEARPDAFRLLAHPIASIVSSAAYNKDPIAAERKPSCIGPYEMTEPWQTGAPVIHLVRSRTYQPRDLAYTVGGRGLMDSIDFRILPDREALYAAYNAGELDVAYLPAAKVAEARQRLGADVVEAASPTLEMIGLPTTKPPFDSPDVRVALSMALDREAVVRAVGGSLRPSGRFLPPTLGDVYVDDSKVFCRQSAKPRGDVEMAKRQLALAKVDLAGTSARLVFNDEYANRALVSSVAQQWEAAFGLRLELVPTPWEKLVDAANTAGGLGDVFRMSWNPEVSDPTAYLKPLFHSTAVQQSNWSRFAFRGFDYQLDHEANQKQEPSDRRTEILAAENLLCGSMPMIPVAQGGFAYAVRQQRVGSAAGRFTDQATGALLLRELYVKAP